jgi:hypothetical protein
MRSIFNSRVCRYQVADRLGIHPSLICKWLKKAHDFREAVTEKYGNLKKLVGTIFVCAHFQVSKQSCVQKPYTQMLQQPKQNCEYPGLEAKLYSNFIYRYVGTHLKRALVVCVEDNALDLYISSYRRQVQGLPVDGYWLRSEFLKLLNDYHQGDH